MCVPNKTASKGAFQIIEIDAWEKQRKLGSDNSGSSFLLYAIITVCNQTKNYKNIACAYLLKVVVIGKYKPIVTNNNIFRAIIWTY